MTDVEKIEKMMLADKSNYMLTKIIAKAQTEKARILYVGVNHFDFSFLVVLKIAGMNFQYGYNGTDKITITCNGVIVDEYRE